MQRKQKSIKLIRTANRRNITILIVSISVRSLVFFCVIIKKNWCVCIRLAYKLLFLPDPTTLVVLVCAPIRTYCFSVPLTYVWVLVSVCSCVCVCAFAAVISILSHHDRRIATEGHLVVCATHNTITSRFHTAHDTWIKTKKKKRLQFFAVNVYISTYTILYLIFYISLFRIRFSLAAFRVVRKKFEMMSVLNSTLCVICDIWKLPQQRQTDFVCVQNAKSNEWN